jgi:hypothetical protein
MVANAWKSISFQLIGLLWLILLIPHLSPTSLKTKFGLMMSKSMVSQILGPCSVLSRHFCSDIFRFSLKYPQGSSVSFSGRFLVEQKAKYGFMTSIRKPLPSFRILDEETIDFRSFDSRFGRFEWSNYLFASSLDGFMLNNSETWSNYSSRYDKSLMCRSFWLNMWVNGCCIYNALFLRNLMVLGMLVSVLMDVLLMYNLYSWILFLTSRQPSAL